MNMLIPDKLQVEVVVQSKCFCCSRNPKMNSPVSDKSTKSLSQKIASIFKTSTPKEVDPTPMRGRTVSFCEE